MKKRVFKIEVALTYKGVYEVEAESQEEALRIIEEDVSECDYPHPGREAENNEQVKDWEFPMKWEVRHVGISGEGK